jgi:hypothetical protein
MGGFSMTHSLWESGNVEAQQPENERPAGLELQPMQPEVEFLPEFEEQSGREQHPEPPSLVQPAEPEILALSVDEFAALEDRILRAVNLVKRERQARSEAEERAARAEAQLREQAPMMDRLQMEVHTLRVERDQVRQRVERLLSQLDALEL